MQKIIIRVLNPKSYFENKMKQNSISQTTVQFMIFQVIHELFYTNNVFISLCFRKHMPGPVARAPVVPATREVEAGGSLEPRSSGL